MCTRNTKITEGGRIVIPAEYRKRLGLKVGDPVTISIVDNQVHILPRSVGINRAKALVRNHVPKGRSLVKELIEDRRREASNE
jgi:AbrB family looped-hinge helix DNA binding protein